jgi:hypothetical protein
MKKCPRWAAAIVVLTVILSTVLAPLEGVAAPGPIKLPNEPSYLFGDPDGPYVTSGVVFVFPFGTLLAVRLPTGVVKAKVDTPPRALSDRVVVHD